MSDSRPATGRGPNLDAKAKRIIELLQADGRMSYSAIAKDVGLSEAAVRHRVQKLIEGGVVQIVAVTDPLQMGFARQAMIGIKVTGDVQEVAAKLGEMDALDYIVITTGRFDILAELVATS
ncbi:MAG TPA: Lrp/AsnC family transcriptional regulator, partial [Acidimicrobiia bacterium]|nr:Lrp/AsnC family transcriptional regulator [Acidimicrobiia bacterium]